jgi:hypothetical protein
LVITQSAGDNVTLLLQVACDEQSLVNHTSYGVLYEKQQFKQIQARKIACG